MKRILCSRYYLMQLIFLVITYFRFSFFLAQLSLQIQNNFKDNQTTVEYLLFVSNFFFIPSMIISPVSGFIVDILKNRIKQVDDSNLNYKSIISCFGIPILLCGLANELMSVMILFCNEFAVYVAYTSCAFTRCFMFSLNAGYILSAFPEKYFGKIFGITITVCGLIGLFQYALLYNELSNLNTVNYVLIGLSSLTFIHPIILMCKI